MLAEIALLDLPVHSRFQIFPKCRVLHSDNTLGQVTIQENKSFWEIRIACAVGLNHICTEVSGARQNRFKELHRKLQFPCAFFPQDKEAIRACRQSALDIEEIGKSRSPGSRGFSVPCQRKLGPLVGSFEET